MGGGLRHSKSYWSVMTVVDIVNTYEKESFTEEEKKIFQYFRNKWEEQLYKSLIEKKDIVEVKTRYAKEEDIERLIEKLREWNGDDVGLIGVIETKFDAMTSIMIIAVQLW